MLHRLPILFWLASAALLRAAAPDYLREIKPLLAAHCVKCHGQTTQKGGLRLDTAAAARQGGGRGPALIAGQSGESLLIAAIEGSHDELPRMPYKRTPLDSADIARLRAWIDAGASAPPDELPSSDRHWSFVPPVRPPVPDVQSARFRVQGSTVLSRNPIDAFILAQLAEHGLQPSPEADRATLIRRVSLDLTGLPPTVAEVDAFVNDRSPDAYEKVVERLLASPHYGERWGRWWLDVARYADSNGYSIDAPRQIWKYRDWVIAAFNRDLPFDQFTIEQLAGDLLPGATLEQKIATGFHRNTQINQEGGIDKEQFRIESVFDRVNTTGTVWLGLTIACAQCHDHKFDPISQPEYYRLFAFLNNQDEPALELPDPTADQSALAAEREEARAELERYLETIGGELARAEAELTPERVARFKADVKAALKIEPAKRTLKQRRTVAAALRYNDQDFKARNDRLTKLETSKAGVVTTLILAERKEPRPTHVFLKGDFTRKGEAVLPGVPAVLPPLRPAARRETPGPEPDAARPPAAAPLPNRLDLARWLVSPENPLTARVTMNRVWQQYFGRGLVETENDFGTMGLPPSHPELLDWLATEFIRQGWSLKAMHRLIVTSATYRQSSKVRAEAAAVDPNNRLLWRQNRLRLEAEIVRDVALAASGLLHPKIGGPSVFPPIADGAMAFTQVKRDWKPSPGPDRYRRGMYTFFYRAAPHPVLTVFDAPDSFSSCTRRIRSNTPLQALTLLNDEAFVECAVALADRVRREGRGSDADKLRFAFRLCVSRAPGAAEQRRLEELLAQQQRAESDERAAWITVARVLLNLDETITRE
jgi:mono/diheme cytochrome c family protein